MIVSAQRHSGTAQCAVTPRAVPRADMATTSAE